MGSSMRRKGDVEERREEGSHKGRRDVGRGSSRSRTWAETRKGMVTLTEVMWWLHQDPRI